MSANNLLKMINYEEIEDRIRNSSTEEELLIVEDEISELVEKNPDVDLDRLYFLIADRKKNLQDHACDPWKLRK